MLVDRFRNIVCQRCWIQRPGIILALMLITLAFLAMVYTATEKSINAMAQTLITMPTRSHFHCWLTKIFG